MARKIFISILGTNKYLEARYYFGEKEKGNESFTRFIQQTTMEKECSDWTENDVAYIFVTKDAKEKNWDNPAQSGEYTGLSKIIENINFKFKTEAVDIPEGISENEIWTIFQRVFNKLEDNDKLYFDITHSFRSIPMLVMVLINYAKFLKNITVNKIYYGAFDKLGPAYKVKEIPIEKRFAPVINLTAFSELQDWTNAANELVNFGSSKNMISLLELKENKTSKKETTQIRELKSNLKKYTSVFTTIRGSEIINGQIFKKLNDNLNRLDKYDSVKTLKPITNKIKDSISLFEEDNIKNGLNAIQWCIKNNLIQQAITLTQEIIINVICDYNTELQLSYENKEHRIMISSLFGVISKDIEEDKWKESLNMLRNKAIIIKNTGIFIEFLPHYTKLTHIRNTINHAGFVGKITGDSIIKGFENVFKEIEYILLKYFEYDTKK